MINHIYAAALVHVWRRVPFVASNQQIFFFVVKLAARARSVEHFAQEAAQLANPVYIPLGPKVSEGLRWLVKQGVLKEDRILHGLPHPSGANAERIAYFLGRKERSALSAKTNATQLDALRDALVLHVQKLA